MNSNGTKKGLGVRKTDKSRRSWSIAEEQALINSLKDLVLTGWKCDNGFKTGFLGILQLHMTSAFPGTDIKAGPHINSKIHVLKKTYGSLSTMMTRSGFGWCDATNTIDVESDDVWKTYVKTDSNARTMRYKSFPYYKDWLEIFGKDRATGENAEDFVDMVQTMEDKHGINNEGGGDYLPEMPFNLQSEATEFQSNDLGQSSTATKTKSSNKRKFEDDTFDQKFFAVMSYFSEQTEGRSGEIAKRIGFEKDRTARARKEVYDALKNMIFLGVEQKICVAKLLVKDTEELDMFFSLPEAERSIYACMIAETSA